MNSQEERWRTEPRMCACYFVVVVVGGYVSVVLFLVLSTFQREAQTTQQRLHHFCTPLNKRKREKAGGQKPNSHAKLSIAGATCTCYMYVPGKGMLLERKAKREAREGHET